MNEISDEAIYELLQSINLDDVKLGIIIGLRCRDEEWWERFNWNTTNNPISNHKTNTYSTYYFFIYKNYMVRLGNGYIGYMNSAIWSIDEIRKYYKVEIINVDEYDN